MHVLGWAQAHPGHSMRRDDDFGLVTGRRAVRARPRWRWPGVALDDIDVVELYDCYTYTVLVTLEDYGFCAKGEGGPFVAERRARAGRQAQAATPAAASCRRYYMWGMTPLSEAVIQARGQGGERQVDAHDLVLVSGNGGVLDHHSTLVLVRRRS